MDYDPDEYDYNPQPVQQQGEKKEPEDVTNRILNMLDMLKRTTISPVLPQPPPPPPPIVTSSHEIVSSLQAVVQLSNKLVNIHPDRQNRFISQKPHEISRQRINNINQQPYKNNNNKKNAAIHYQCECGNKWITKNLDAKYQFKKCQSCGTFRRSIESLGLPESFLPIIK